MTSSPFNRQTVPLTVPDNRNEQFRRRIPTPVWVDRMVSIGALIGGVAYLGWRGGDTLSDTDLLLSMPLFLAEVVLWLSFGAVVRRAWRRPVPVPAHSGEIAEIAPVVQSVDVLITTLNDSEDAVRISLISCHSLDRPHRVWILDDGGRSEIAALAADHGAEYIHRDNAAGARAGNINNALPLSDADLVLLLRAGDVAFPDLLSYAIPLLASPDVGESATAGVIAAAVERDAERGHWDIETTDTAVVNPSLNQMDAAIWNEGPALFRRALLVELGGLVTDTVTTELATTLALWDQGYCVRTSEITLSEVPGAANLTAELALRDRWARGRMQTLRSSHSPLSSGFSSAQRAAVLGQFGPMLGSVARITIVGVAVVAILSSSVPVNASVGVVAVAWAAAAAVRATARWLLSDGRITPFADTHHELAFLGVHLRSLGTLISGRPAKYRFAPRDGLDPSAKDMLARVPALVVSMVALAAAMVFGVEQFVQDTNALPRNEHAALLIAGFAILVPTVVATSGWVTHRERRIYQRQTVEIATRIDGNVCRVLDLVADGLGIESGTQLAPDSVVTVALRLPDPAGVHHELSLRATVRWSTSHADGMCHAGLEFVDLRPIHRDRLVEFSSVTVPYGRIGRLPETTATVI